MREIKFRVWDKDNKKYISNAGNPNIFPFNGKIGMTCNGNSTGYISTNDYIQECYELEQYIGLKDKNGKEIYERDIIKCHDKHHKDEIYKVYYDGAGFLPFADSWDECPYPDPEQCEIIGNKFENPEALK